MILQGTPPTAVGNPQAGSGITLSSTAKSLSQNGGGGILTFGYCANVTGSVYIGFYGGVGMTSLSQTIPVTMVAKQFEVTGYSVNTSVNPPITTLEINTELPSTTQSFQSTLKANFSINAGISLGFKLLDTFMISLKCGWSSLRITSSVQNELTATNPTNTNTPSQSANYSPKYLNGVSGSIGAEYFATQRISVGVEVFGIKYADKNLAVFSYHMDPTAKPNIVTDSQVGTYVTTQTLMASPMSVSSWGVLVSVKVNFTEQ